MSVLQLTTLETRRKRGDLIEAFETVKNFDNVDSNIWIKLSATGLRGHDYKLFKQPCRLNFRYYFLVKELSMIGINYQQISSIAAR